MKFKAIKCSKDLKHIKIGTKIKYLGTFLILYEYIGHTSLSYTFEYGNMTGERFGQGIFGFKDEHEIISIPIKISKYEI